MHIRVDAIHKKALEVVARYRSCEADLIEVLQQADSARVCYALGYNSLYHYCTEGLGLSEDIAYAFISLARKSTEVPALKEEIRSGKITVSKAKRIVPVLNKSNQSHWLDLAKSVSKKELEKAVVTEKPELAVPEKVKFVQAQRVHVQFGASPELAKKLERARQIESQKTGRVESLENAVDAMADVYLLREDPLEKAKRYQQRANAKSSNQHEKENANVNGSLPADARRTDGGANSNDANLNLLGPGPVNVHGASISGASISGAPRAVIAAATRHELNLKYNGQCGYIDDKGKRCNERRFLHIHHKKALIDGGDNSLNNLELLCAGHHQAHHHHH